MMVLLNEIKNDLRKKENPEKAKILQRFFKTGKGEYGEGDIFLGLTSEEIKQVSKMHASATLKDLDALLNSQVHEERVLALRILVLQFNKSSEEQRKVLINFYLSHTTRINNWDLVDMSAPYTLGKFLQDKDRSILYKLAKSPILWEKRISIISCFAFIKENDFKDTLEISEILLGDPHDLIHKAVGWMLREVGNRSIKAEEIFLKKYYKQMPRTMLRYAIEKFPEQRRKAYLEGKI